MIQIKIYIPNKLKSDMDKYPDINWPAVAIQAIRAKIQTLKNKTAAPKPE
jgi:hypothetical protein